MLDDSCCVRVVSQFGGGGKGFCTSKIQLEHYFGARAVGSLGHGIRVGLICDEVGFILYCARLDEALGIEWIDFNNIKRFEVTRKGNSDEQRVGIELSELKNKNGEKFDWEQSKYGRIVGVMSRGKITIFASLQLRS